MSSKTESKIPSNKAETSLTFGLELEFILIQKRLEAIGIPSVLDGDDHEVTEEEYQTCWTLKDDLTIGEGEGVDSKKLDKRYVINGMEMASPPYYYSEAARKEIQKVLKTVRNNYRVCVDQSTGLHVHVGNSYNGLQFPKLRNLMAIAYTYELQMLLILPQERASGNWCPPLSKSKFGWKNPDLTRLETFENILDYTDNHSLLEDFGEHLVARLAFNIEGLRTPYESGRRTIEFRHHHGTLDPDAILNWIHVCIKFVEKACFANDDELFKQLRQDVSKPIGFGDGELSTVDFLMWLGCPSQAYYYGIGMVSNKDAIVERIKQDKIEHERHLEQARTYLERECQQEEEDLERKRRQEEEEGEEEEEEEEEGEDSEEEESSSSEASSA
ncbi:hypothetical protein SBOR_7840 [Sclerotinia borealis F-4128]|uniref:Amidoligase enzyme n=1 Tax=Sclerotinia borealis (strain F-4128) TaxID=1432307 RepID=W9CB43_SCLBF|nr:hypothetical protein SBOR_7840 [Sclerotinia borealis F-4128]